MADMNSWVKLQKAKALQDTRDRITRNFNGVTLVDLDQVLDIIDGELAYLRN